MQRHRRRSVTRKNTLSLSRQKRTRFTCLNTILGWCMVRPWLCSGWYPYPGLFWVVRNRFWTGIWSRLVWRLRMGLLAQLGIRLAPRRESGLQPQRMFHLSRAIVNRGNFNSNRPNFNHGADSRGRGFDSHQSFHGSNTRAPHSTSRRKFQ